MVLPNVVNDSSCRVALIIGITGQTGSYLAELLLSKGYRVHGVIRRSSSFNTGRIDHIFDKLTLHFGDVTDASSIQRALRLSQPDEVYNLAAQSHVKVSFDQPIYTAESVAMGALNVLEAVREHRDATGREIRLYQASSSEMFGMSPPPQNENTSFRPCSPYACAKVHAYHAVVNYRSAYGLFACNGILFNHESPRRGETFVTRKITRGLARISLGLQKELLLGDVTPRRDWGYAPEFAEAMWLMMQLPVADDYVIGTGESHSIESFLSVVANHLGVDPKVCRTSVPQYLRPCEVPDLQADYTKANLMLGWEPQMRMADIAVLMADADLELAKC